MTTKQINVSGSELLLIVIIFFFVTMVLAKKENTSSKKYYDGNGEVLSHEQVDCIVRKYFVHDTCSCHTYIDDYNELTKNRKVNNNASNY